MPQYRTTGVAEKPRKMERDNQAQNASRRSHPAKTAVCECVNAFLGRYSAQRRISLAFSATSCMANWASARIPQLVLARQPPATVRCFACLDSFAARGNWLLERVRELRIGEEPLVSERLQEGHEGGLLGIREIQPAHPGVEIGVWLDSRAVVIDHLLERVEASVMHVGGGALDVAQGRRLELAEL